MAPRWTLAALLFVASVAALRSPQYSLREQPPSNCGFAHYGSAEGSAQRLAETQLAPGVADWNIVVPMPPPCAEARVTGADMRVCDVDAPPDVAMSDARLARVHRTGQLAGFATMNVTVYCILSPPLPSTAPPPPLPPPSTTHRIALPLSHLRDSMSTYEMLSNELSSKEETSYESELADLKSDDFKTLELTTITVKPTSSTTLPTTQAETTANVELTSPTEVVTARPNNTTSPKEKTPHALKVTINITPSDQVSTEEDESQSNGIQLPSLSNKENPDEKMSSQSPGFSSAQYIVTEPQISAMSSWKHVKQPRGPGSPVPPEAYQHADAHRLPIRPRLWPLHYAPDSQYSAMPSPYDLMPPYSFAPVYRPLSLLSPQLTLLQRRQPLLFFRHF